MIYDIDKLWGDFTRPFKEVDQARLYRHPENKGYILVINALGIDNDHIKVEYKEATAGTLPTITVTGSQQNEFSQKTYSVNYAAGIRITEVIEDVVYDCKDGLCTIFFKIKKEDEREAVFARKITSDFKW